MKHSLVINVLLALRLIQILHIFCLKSIDIIDVYKKGRIL